ncbi:MAG: DnaJ C-terminal domain-containing protein, partial [Thermoplasmatota archaeon]
QVQRRQQTPFGTLSQVGPCPTCHGEGRKVTHPCRACHGAGQQRARRTVTVHVPAGIEGGQSLRVAGQGEAGPQGSHGDLYVEIQLRDHPRFLRQGSDLVAELPVSIPQAVLGAALDVDTLDGTVTLEIPAGSQPGQVLRLRGKGMPSLRGGRGDLHVRLRYVVPQRLGDRGRQLFEELATELDGHLPKAGKAKKGLFGFLKE